MTRLLKQGSLLTFLINLEGLRATCLELLIERTCIHPNVFCPPAAEFEDPSPADRAVRTAQPYAHVRAYVCLRNGGGQL